MLLIVSPGFPEDENDTTCLPAVQQFVLSLIKFHNKQNITVLSFQYPFFSKEYFWYGIKVISLGRKNKSGFKRVFTWLKAYRMMRKIHQQEKITGILSLWLTECALIGNIFAKRKNIKMYMWLHGQDAKKSNRYVKRVRPQASQVIAISEFIQNEFAKNHDIKPFMIAENGINPECYSELNTAMRSIDILGVGSLIKLKNYNFFIEIVAEIKYTHPHVKVLIAGEGPERNNLLELIKKKGLQNNVHLIGKISHTEVLNIMNDSKIFLHTSLYEGNSTVLAEALYSGCQVISTQGLNSKLTENLFVTESANEMIAYINSTLNNLPLPQRVVFNLMDDTAKKILALFK